MSKVKFARRIEFLVTETYKRSGEYLLQKYQFWTPNKKYLKYAYDHRFCLRRKLEALYKKELLQNLEFVSKDESEDNVTFKYKLTENDLSLVSKTFNCEFYLPPYNGCVYCTKSKQEGDFLFCTEKKKHYDSQGIKTCPIFQSIDEIIS